MARAESKMIMGCLPIEERHHPALISLVARHAGCWWQQPLQPVTIGALLQ